MASIDLKDNIAVTTVTHSKISLEELQVFCWPEHWNNEYKRFRAYANNWSFIFANKGETPKLEGRVEFYTLLLQCGFWESLAQLSQRWSLDTTVDLSGYESWSWNTFMLFPFQML